MSFMELRSKKLPNLLNARALCVLRSGGFMGDPVYLQRSLLKSLLVLGFWGVVGSLGLLTHSKPSACWTQFTIKRICWRVLQCSRNYHLHLNSTVRPTDPSLTERTPQNPYTQRNSANRMCGLVLSPYVHVHRRCWSAKPSISARFFLPKPQQPFHEFMLILQLSKSCCLAIMLAFLVCLPRWSLCLQGPADVTLRQSWNKQALYNALEGAKQTRINKKAPVFWHKNSSPSSLYTLVILTNEKPTHSQGQDNKTKVYLTF